MAEGALFSIAGGIINSLAPLVRDEIGLLWGVQTELEKLQKTVTAVKNVLQDAEKQKTGSQVLNGWLEELSAVLYEADDLLDLVSTVAQRREIMTKGKKMKKVRVFFSKSNQLIYGLNMGHKIKEMKEKFGNIAANINNFRFLENAVETRVINRKREETYSSLGAEKIIGRESDKVAVINHLMESNVEANVSIISIVGFGGLGKTALAKLIFDDEQIQKYFEVKIWICVSDSFEIKDVIKKILETTKREKPPTDLMETLVHDLKNEINGKKYLLVLDDIWNENSEKWFDLKNQLMSGREGSKILITTRKEKVAKIMRSKRKHELSGLKEQDSWELFKEVAFENGIVPENLEAMGKVILKRCRGVPLAIKTIGRLLYSESLERWQKFISEELSTIEQEAIDILPTLKLSYDDLSSHLKHCFAFCSLFPKDYMFDTSTLISLWIANGYVESKGNQCWEEIGYKYFMDLLRRSFFQEAEMNDFGDVIKCKMHDLMHDLAELVAGPLITTIPFKGGNSYKETRHIAVAYNMSSCFAMLDSLYNTSTIRTFLCPTAYESYHQGEIDWEAIIKGFKCLRVLDLGKRNLKHVPSSIGKLKHLRYLTLSNNKEIKELPRSITKMVNLQYLYLSNCKQLVRFPKNFKRLINLRHLDVGGCESLRCMPNGMGQLTNLHMLNLRSCKSLKELPRDIIKLVNLRFVYMDSNTGFEYMPCGFGKLSNLQELRYFVADSGSTFQDSVGLDELNGLNNLRGSLEIKVVSFGKDVAREYKAANLKDKQNLDSLKVEWQDAVVNDFDDDILLESLQPHLNLKHLDLRYNRSLKHPMWLLSLAKLVSLRLIGCTKWQYLPPLSRLPFLEDLYLEGIDGIEYLSDCDEWSTSSSSSLVSLPLFPSLKKIYLGFCKNLKGWWKSSPTEVESLLISFPLLSSVDISYCQMLTSMPIFWHLKESLTWRGTNWKPLQQTLMMNTLATTTFSIPPCALLSKLNGLEFVSIKDLENLPEEGLQNLNSLKILRFSYCPKLKSLSPGVQHLTKVQRLDIWNCPMFGDNEDRMQWEGLKSLSDLFFLDLPKLSSLPSGLRNVTTLKRLQISRCGSLTSIPEWIHRSLEALFILNCSNLASLPIGTRERWSLQRLFISGSPILLQKCKKEKGEYWPKIAHILDLNIS